jgi:predicted lipoprotein
MPPCQAKRPNRQVEPSWHAQSLCSITNGTRSPKHVSQGAQPSIALQARQQPPSAELQASQQPVSTVLQASQQPLSTVLQASQQPLSTVLQASQQPLSTVLQASQQPLSTVLQASRQPHHLRHVAHTNALAKRGRLKVHKPCRTHYDTRHNAHTMT